MVAAACLWGTNGTARHLGPDGASSVSVGAIRLVVGGVVLLAVVLARGAWRRRADWPRGPAAVAVVAMAAYQPLFFAGIGRAGVAVGTVVGIGSSPIAGGLLGRVVRGEHLSRSWWLATGLGLAGAAVLALASGEGDAAGGGGRADVVVGLLLAAGAGVAYAVYVVASAAVLDTGLPPFDVAAVVLGLAGVLLVPLAVAGDTSWLGEPSGVALAAWLGLATVAVAYPLLAAGLHRVGVSATATLTLAEPATAALLGVVVVGERLTTLGWAGLALAAAGVVVQARSRSAT